MQSRHHHGASVIKMTALSKRTNLKGLKKIIDQKCCERYIFGKKIVYECKVKDCRT